MSKLMTRQQFRRLCEYLQGPDGCNFEDAPDEPDGMTWDCDGTLKLTRRWLKRHNLDIETNVAALNACGGYCDCEIIFNAVDRWENYLQEHQK